MGMLCDAPALRSDRPTHHPVFSASDSISKDAVDMTHLAAIPGLRLAIEVE